MIQNGNTPHREKNFEKSRCEFTVLVGSGTVLRKTRIRFQAVRHLIRHLPAEQADAFTLHASPSSKCGRPDSVATSPRKSDGVPIDKLFGKPSPPIHNFCFSTPFQFIHLKTTVSPKV